MLRVKSKLQASWEASLSLAGLWESPHMVGGGIQAATDTDLGAVQQGQSAVSPDWQRQLRVSGPDHELPFPTGSLLGQGQGALLPCPDQ